MKESLDIRLFRAGWVAQHWKWASIYLSVRWAVRHWRPFVQLGLGLVVWFLTLHWQAGLVTFLAAWFAMRPKGPSTRDQGERWWSAAVLPQALVSAGVLRADGPNLPMVSHRGQPIHTEEGTTVIVGLPQATTLADVQAKRVRLAAALRIPAMNLEVSQAMGDSANVVRLKVWNTAPTPTTQRSPVAVAEYTDWRAPIRAGLDPRGRQLNLDNDEQNSLIAGLPGKGKTSFGRIRVAHYLLDPRTSVFLLDGKGSSKDYGECRPMLSAYVSGTADLAVEESLLVFHQILDEVRRRNTGDPEAEHPGWLLILEEYQEIRAQATKDQQEQLDKTLGRIIRMGRAVAVHVQILTQRPSVDDIPSGCRNLVEQRVSFEMRDSADVALILGANRVGGIEMPKGRGVALVAAHGQLSHVVTDRLTNEDWTRVCARARRLRTHAPSGAPELPSEPQEPATAPQDEDGPLMASVATVLGEGDPRGMTATQIHSELPSWAQTAYPTGHALSLVLARHPEVVTRSHIGSSRGWKLSSRSATLT